MYKPLIQTDMILMKSEEQISVPRLAQIVADLRFRQVDLGSFAGLQHGDLINMVDIYHGSGDA